jgi:hypothetical protein
LNKNASILEKLGVGSLGGCLWWCSMLYSGDTREGPTYFKEWNEAIDKRDMTVYKKEFISNGKSAIKTGGISLLIGLFVNNAEFHWKNHLNIFGYTQLLSGVAYLIQAKQFDKAVFEEDSKQTLLSPFIISPMIRPDYSGIMLVKRF